MKTREVFDIEGRKVEVGDLVILPKFTVLAKAYVLGFTGRCITLSCFKEPSRFSGTMVVSHMGWSRLSIHNDRQNISEIPSIYIIEKNATIPDNLKKFIK